MADPRVIAVSGPAVEPLDRRLPIVEQNDFAEVRPVLAREPLERRDLVEPGVVLGHDDVAPAVEVGRRHRPDDGPHDRPRVGLLVLPPADQEVQAVDVEVQGAGVPVGVERRQVELPMPAGPLRPSPGNIAGIRI